MVTALLSIAMLLADAGSPPSLSGTVYSTQSVTPIANATIIVYSASPASKNTPVAPPPGGYPDCLKTVTSDAKGQFTIAGVDPVLNFQLLIVADGFRPIMLRKVDPARGEIIARLKPIPKDLKPELSLKGHVVDSDGKPVVGARIDPYGMRDGQNRNWGGQGEVIEEGPTFTDAKGNFLLIAKKEDVQVDVKITGRGIAPTLCPLLTLGDQPNEITVTAGAIVTGRIVKDGKGLANVEVCLSQKDRDIEHYVGDITTTTDADGKFIGHGLKPNEDYNVYATMKGLAGQGAMQMNLTHVGDPGTNTDVGDLIVDKGYTVSGQIFCSDGKPVPVGTKVTLSREEASDDIETTVGKDGKYEFKAIPDGLMEFYVESRGYHVSDQNESFEPDNAHWLLGLVNQDITDLRVQLDPGPPPQNNYQSNKWNELETTELRGVTEQQ